MRFVGIDPSTKTGFVALSSSGELLKVKEITGVGNKDPYRMATLIDEIVAHIQKDDLIVIEGFGYASQQAIQLGGIGWGIRMALLRRGFTYYDVAPNAVKKFVNITGWIGEPGKKRRLKGKEKKKAVMDAVNEMYGFTHRSDNVIDAFILAKIAQDIWISQNNILRIMPKFQKEVIENILHPEKKERG